MAKPSISLSSARYLAMSSYCAPLPSPCSVTPAAPAPGKLVTGSAAYRRTGWALFCAGFATFAMLYGVQPLLPLFSAEFGSGAAHASTVLSAGTLSMALMLIPASLLADRLGRKPLMVAALLVGALLTLAATLTQGFGALVWSRAAFGMVLAGLPAVAMAYLSEEVEASSLGKALGLYIAGNALGGMSGRYLAALLADVAGWRLALAVLGGLGLLAAALVWKQLPPSRHFQPARGSLAQLWHNGRRHFADAGLPWLFLSAFLLMGCFVSLYNYLGYRLLQAPFGLSQSQIGLVFLLYVVGIWSSAWAGTLADRLGRRNVLWLMIVVMAAGLLLTLPQQLLLVVGGVALFTFGFFGAHSVASSWVGRRALQARALASACYLTAYYAGSSVMGTLSGVLWESHRWPGVAACLSLLLLAALAIALHLRRLPPLPGT
ncbi:YNFM family putative membrane transporter [Vogesella indigofera]|uniref:YNFM family putative membrane transporter n=2 Tax=Vogesella indigofera TaxID=45465 RepID=A0A495BBY1_VOGIN|nr:YNFM family putative membrane transporter [Vogesella indigofera]